jgi:hypothetical protein
LVDKSTTFLLLVMIHTGGVACALLAHKLSCEIILITVMAVGIYKQREISCPAELHQLRNMANGFPYH